MSSNFGSNLFPIAAAVVIIVIAIGISAAVQGSPEKAMSQIITVGPVWNTDAWLCTSDADFVVHAAIRGIGADPLPLIAVSVQDHGTQSFYSMDNSKSVAFTVGNQADKTITITRTGTVTGFLTLQTTSNAQASCIAV
jgi:hypothetical protein